MPTRLLKFGEVPEPTSAPQVLPIARKGFRPFFLLASAFACTMVPIWVLVVAGTLRPAPYFDATSWHAHEMVFGFTVAVIAGFLLTAVGNWTQRETLVGPPLMALAGLWVAGRLVMAIPGLLPRGIPAAVDIAFLPVLLVVLARPLIAANNRRNYVLLGVLGSLVVTNVAMHMAALGVLSPGTARTAALVAVDVVVAISLMITGRVMPMFTRNATGATDVRSIPVLDSLTMVGAAALTMIDAVQRESRVAALTAGVVGALAVARAARWGTFRTGRIPLLWILHAGYAWLCLGLLLRAVAGLAGAIPETLATHALTVGAIGSLILGMMARVALGHTGRPLVAPRPMAAAFVLVTAAAIVRVFVPLLAPGAYLLALIEAAALWTAAFLLYLVAYAPILSSPRVDGRSG
jgi:uncharacterized protein involved in response to NO